MVWIDKGVNLMDELARYDDSPNTLRVASLLALTRAGILSDLGRVPEAMAAAEKPVAMKRKLLQLHPGDSDLSIGLASSLRVYSEDLDGWQRPAEACAAAREARGILDSMAAHGGIPARIQKADAEPLDARLKACPKS
ncbi:MAG: hypothetical protein WDN06_14520 [Asticcacaulis sp.]